MRRTGSENSEHVIRKFLKERKAKVNLDSVEEKLGILDPVQYFHIFLQETVEDPRGSPISNLGQTAGGFPTFTAQNESS